jgi:hypothetical protein
MEEISQREIKFVLEMEQTDGVLVMKVALSSLPLTPAQPLLLVL